MTRFAFTTTAATALVASLAACTSSTGSPATVKPGGRVANVTITNSRGCTLDHDSFPAGGITFKIRNQDATAVTEVELLSGERIVGEKENVPAGLGGDFAVRVSAGTYTLYCPGAARERTPVRVTGRASTSDASVAALLKSATDEYKSYVDTQVGYLVTATQALVTAVKGTDLVAAQERYMLARPYYEKIEPVAESFVNGKDNLDADIDARINDVPADQFEGFHRLELGLFQAKSLAGLSSIGDKLLEDVKELRAKTASLRYQAPDLANGAQELLDEVASTKITGEEERYSHIDILDMANNVEGAAQAFADLQPALRLIDSGLAATVSSAFDVIDTLLDSYRTSSNASGYVYYSALDDSDRRALAAAVKAVQEPLSQVASKVANA